MADSPYRVAQLLKLPRRYWMQALMVDPETAHGGLLTKGPWWIQRRPMAGYLDVHA
jgi:hypothetical protein